MSDYALFSCGNLYCAQEVSFPASELRVWNGKPYCQECYEAESAAAAGEDEEPGWFGELPAFVPPYEQRIAELEAERDELQDALDAQIETAAIGRSELLDALAERDRLREAAEAVITVHKKRLRTPNGWVKFEDAIHRLSAALAEAPAQPDEPAPFQPPVRQT